jgi:hypothetical protein
MLKKPAITMPATTGSRSMVSGMNGSGAFTSRSANRPHSSAEPPSSKRISGDDQR